MSKGQLTLPVFQSLQAFWPGLLSLMGDISSAMKSLHNMHSVWKRFGFLPEFYNIPNAEAGLNRESYPLRPELIESVMYLYRATGDPYLLEVGEDFLRSIQYSAKTACGYATIKNVKDHRKQDTMESFFLAETTKYLYLLFDPDNFLNSDGGHGTVFDTPNGECIIESYYVFNTEAHPIDVGALKCCHDVPRESLVKGFNRKQFMGESVGVFDRSSFMNQENSLTEETLLEEPEGSTEDFKKILVGEIMSALSNAKKKIEENVELQKRFLEIANREKDGGSFNLETNTVDVTQAVKKTEEDNDVVKEEPIEIVKLPSDALDSDNVDPQKTSEIISESSEMSDNDIDNPPVEAKIDGSIIQKPVDSNNSNFVQDFVQAILKTGRKPKKFDAQQLLEKIREDKYPRNESWSQRFDLMTCKAQPYLQRISVMGEFY